MMDSTPLLRFDGQKWTCERCRSTLANIVKAECFSLPTMEKQIVTALELPAGYICIKGNDGVETWVKPRKLHPFQRGAQNRTDRQKARDFTKWQLEKAERQSDFASISEAQRKLQRSDEIKTAPSVPIPEQTKPVRLFAGELPAKIQCEKCKTALLLPAIRGAITSRNTSQGHTGSGKAC